MITPKSFRDFTLKMEDMPQMDILGLSGKLV